VQDNLVFSADLPLIQSVPQKSPSSNYTANSIFTNLDLENPFGHESLIADLLWNGGNSKFAE